MIKDSTSFINVLQKNVESVLMTINPDSSAGIQAQIDELQKKIIEKSDRNEDYEDEAKKILSLRKQKDNASLNDDSGKEALERIKKLQDFIAYQSDAISEFDESLVKHLLEKITVNENELVFTFKSGITITVEN